VLLEHLLVLQVVVVEELLASGPINLVKVDLVVVVLVLVAPLAEVQQLDLLLELMIAIPQVLDGAILVEAVVPLIPPLVAAAEAVLAAPVDLLLVQEREVLEELVLHMASLDHP